LLFSRKNKRGLVPAQIRQESGNARQEPPALFKIEYDLMVKGSVVKRNGRPVRQFGVTIDGSTRLVTSGDVVDRKTYEALLAVGAIRERSLQELPGEESGAPPRETPPEE
jgi:hypothetical protein